MTGSVLSCVPGACYVRDTMAPARSARTLRLRAALAVLLFAVSACFIFNRGSKAAAAPAIDVPEGEIALSVTNHNYLDVVVYVLHDGLQTRVGTVTGSSSTVFFLPARLLGQAREIQLLGDAIGNDAYARTDILVVQRGQYIEWTLETDLRRSSVGVF
jgi:hypothetical protein